VEYELLGRWSDDGLRPIQEGNNVRGAMRHIELSGEFACYPLMEFKLQSMLATMPAISTSPLNRSLMSSLSLLIFFLLLVRRHLGEFMNIDNPYSVEIVALLF